MTISDIRLKRIYDPVEDRDGTRILIDRLWPRGMSKERAALDAWMPEIGPSHELRKWYAHEPERWETFRQRYREELAGREEGLEQLRESARKGPLTLLFSATDRDRNQAVVVRQFLQEDNESS
ncbi:hypothetical protein A33O_05950 [Nitratireductor aquibiodomus RA22]|uniref:Uroporphyrin-III C-methyltransferase n=1 Tax=Nitratireductor aquibiodomus RA22 TaxID=1189611 RepID=I5C2Z5_9HYPH|nr:DUF488 domain-containing protein [Nitratireductor aquibiodomus]EIM76197.1 hypothetical protein A33O_05950 [Nitratireductor aquibiodomus RA22]